MEFFCDNPKCLLHVPLPNQTHSQHLLQSHQVGSGAFLHIQLPGSFMLQSMPMIKQVTAYSTPDHAFVKAALPEISIGDFQLKLGNAVYDMHKRAVPRHEIVQNTVGSNGEVFSYKGVFCEACMEAISALGSP